MHGRPALKWIMERQTIKKDKASGIVNDSNRYGIETMGDAAYPFKLLLRIVRVSMETLRIVENLPKLELDDD